MIKNGKLHDSKTGELNMKKETAGVAMFKKGEMPNLCPRDVASCVCDKPSTHTPMPCRDRMNGKIWILKMCDECGGEVAPDLPEKTN